MVIYPYLHHYRQGVFEELDRSEDVAYTFLADTTGAHGIATMASDRLKRFCRVRTYRAGAAEFQPAVLTHIARRRDYDAVIFLGNAANLTTWLGALLARALRMRVYFWTIGWHRPEKGVKKWIRFRFYQVASRLLLYGNSGFKIGRALGFPAHKMSVIGNSILIPLAETGEQSAVTTQTTIWLGAVARITRVKRFDLLIHACSLLRATGLDVGALLAGDGPEKASLQRMATQLGVPFESIPAVYGPDELSHIYDRLAVTVVPAAVGLTAIQSMAFGTPVISNDSEYTQMPEWEAIVQGATGELYQSGSVEDLAAAIVRQLERIDADALGVTQRCCEEYASRWSPSAHAMRIESVITGDVHDDR